MEEENVGRNIDTEIGRLLAEQEEEDSSSEVYRKRADIIKLYYQIRNEDVKNQGDYEIRMAELNYKIDELRIAEEANAIKKAEIKEAKKSRWSDFFLKVAGITVGGLLAAGAMDMQNENEKKKLQLTEDGYLVKDNSKPNYIESIGKSVTGFIGRLF